MFPRCLWESFMCKTSNKNRNPIKMFSRQKQKYSIFLKQERKKTSGKNPQKIKPTVKLTLKKNEKQGHEISLSSDYLFNRQSRLSYLKAFKALNIIDLKNKETFTEISCRMSIPVGNSIWKICSPGQVRARIYICLG